MPHGTHIPAKIVVPGQISPAPCIIQEISLGSARLELDPDWVIPKTFWLCIDFASCVHPCRLVWREGHAAEVAFSAGHELT